MEGLLLISILFNFIIFIKWVMSRQFNDQEVKSKTSSPTESSPGELYRISQNLTPFFENTAHPKDLLSSELFQSGVSLLSSRSFSEEDLRSYLWGDNILISCIAFESLRHREVSEELTSQVSDRLNETYLWPIFFAFQFLNETYEGNLLPNVFFKVQQWWPSNTLMCQLLNQFIEDRLGKGERLPFDAFPKDLESQQIELIGELFPKLKKTYTEPLLESYEALKHQQVDTTFFNSLGKLWDMQAAADSLLEHSDAKRHLGQLMDALFETPPRSVLLVGETGVGKTALVQQLSEKIAQKGWRVFEASANDVLAGQVYLGELENRLKELIVNLDPRRRVIWFIPNFHELLYAGRANTRPTGILEQLSPILERGDICIIGETQPAAYQHLLSDYSRLESLVETLKIKELNDQDTFECAVAWSKYATNSPNRESLISEPDLKEAYQLVKQFLNNSSQPGNLMNLLKLTRRQMVALGEASGVMTIDRVYQSLSSLSGMPRSILDDSQAFNLEELRQLFDKRVLGQPEAVECLVERVAMIKAGLTDPGKPSGVFLFAGPTGTGKTEIAKTLAEFLFGSPDRMIRLDMSEYQMPGSVESIIGEGQGSSGSSVGSTSLVKQIRNHPFSVVLLDEFEKAHPKVWDLFLQVFDDGRLTDSKGSTADFRHSIIILTSNLGATIKTDEGIGFQTKNSRFSSKGVVQTIYQTFRREFINRLDRVVVFRPLSRNVMRQILYHEFDQALQRRGLRSRDWAIELETSAIDFLLEKGFTHDLGARPLKRAIDRYLLANLAVTIVNHQFPEGDQFLFVRRKGNQLEVEFVDPNSSVDTEPSDDTDNEQADLTLKTLIRSPHGTSQEVAFLEGKGRELSQTIQSEPWKKEKEDALLQTSEPSFWESEERFQILGQIEFLDRMETAFGTKTSLLQRLTGHSKTPKTTYSKELIRRIAQYGYLLEAALETVRKQYPQDVFLKLETRDDSLECQRFLHQICQMYQQWASNRNMRQETLVEASTTSYALYAFSGLGSYAILKDEEGIHTLEVPKKGKTFQRHLVRVRVAGQPVVPKKNGLPLIDQALACFQQDAMHEGTLVRNYRQEPSPLVRDMVGNWRTGRIERVWAGDFDLFGP